MAREPKNALLMQPYLSASMASATGKVMPSVKNLNQMLATIMEQGKKNPQYAKLHANTLKHALELRHWLTTLTDQKTFEKLKPALKEGEETLPLVEEEQEVGPARPATEDEEPLVHGRQRDDAVEASEGAGTA